jgi:hypothetical protein
MYDTAGYTVIIVQSTSSIIVLTSGFKVSRYLTNNLLIQALNKLDRNIRY